jgi:PASTA domain
MAILDGKVKIPLMGDVPKKGAAIGAGIFALFIGVIYIRHRNNASTTNASPAGGTAAAAAGDTGLVTDPAGNQCVAVDPNSGYCPGTDQDQAYQSEQSGGYNDAYGDTGDVGDTGGSYGGAGLYVDPNGNTCTTPNADGYCPAPTGGATGTGSSYASNEAWLTAAESAMHAPALSGAAERIFAGLAVTNAQKDLFLEAVGLIGPPPQSYPAIHLKDTPGQPAKSEDVTVPTVTGQRRIEATAKLRAAGLSPTVTETQKVPAGKEAVVINTDPNGGAKVAKGSKVTVNVGPR